MDTNTLNTSTDSNAYRPLLLNLKNKEDKQVYDNLLASPYIRISDTLKYQLKELVKNRNTSGKPYTAEELENLVEAHIKKNGNTEEEYGIWVYYPWKNSLIHLVDEEEFVFLRTIRNNYKITPAEQQALRSKKVGIIGLSVGHAVAMTMVTERVVGELRLADFDTLDLTNLNRIRTCVENIGIPKVNIAARQIAEIDPFVKVSVYADGFTFFNADDFLIEGGKLDVLVEECDSLDIKIFARIKAREHGIAVVMATSDAGIMDVERFDKDQTLPLLHGKIPDMPLHELGSLTTEEKMPILIGMLGMDLLTDRMKASGLEIGKTLTTWPQLASSVDYDGAVITDIVRRIFLNQFTASGRFQIEVDKLIADPIVVSQVAKSSISHAPQLSEAYIKRTLVSAAGTVPGNSFPESLAKTLVEAAIMAPSGGNNQPWKWVLENNRLFLFHDESRIGSFIDFGRMAYVGIGAAIENIQLKAQSLKTNLAFHPNTNGDEKYIGYFEVKGGYKETSFDHLSEQIDLRITNRKKVASEAIPEEVLSKLKEAAESVAGVKYFSTTDRESITRLAQITGEADRLRMFHEESSKELFREICWTKAEAEKRGDGIDARTLDIDISKIAGFQAARNPNVVKLLKEWNLGAAFSDVSYQATLNSSCICTLAIPKQDLANYLACGRAFQKLWLTATKENISLQPMTVSTVFFNRMRANSLEGFDEQMKQSLTKMFGNFNTIFPYTEDTHHLMLFRLFKTDEKPQLKSLRLPVEEVLEIFTKQLKRAV